MPNVDFKKLRSLINDFFDEEDFSHFVKQIAALFKKSFEAPSEFDEFAGSPVFEEIISTIVFRYEEQLDPNEPNLFMSMFPKDWAETLDIGEIEHGLYGAHSGRGPNELIEALGVNYGLRSQQPLTLYFDLNEFDEYEVAELLSSLSDIYRSLGGEALIVDRVSLSGAPEILGVPQ